jgi:hypothetical protein
MMSAACGRTLSTKPPTLYSDTRAEDRTAGGARVSSVLCRLESVDRDAHTFTGTARRAALSYLNITISRGITCSQRLFRHGFGLLSVMLDGQHS